MNNTTLTTTTQLLIRIRAFQHRCWKQGNPISIDTLLKPHPRLKQNEECLLELIYGEYCVRESLGEQPTCRQYCEQFPQLTERLERLLEVHRALDSGTPSFASIQQTVHVSEDCSVVISPDTIPTEDLVRGNERITPRQQKAPQKAPLGQFGDYHLLEEIARGGMGVVYRAQQVQAKRMVALKMILAGKFATEKELKRFYSEAEAAARLDHPNIVPIYEVGEQDGHPFFTMAYVNGQNLAARIAEGPLAQREAANLTREIASAIDYAHQHGIIHRDLKPANILLTSNGQTRITDFGLAKRIDDQANLTVTGDVVGTPSYMSPEQVHGNPTDVGVSTDVYSLGAILYCLLTGRPPFQAATILETFTQLTQVEPVPPRQLVPTINPDLETICLKCLQKAPHKRYPTATELLNDLDRYLEGKPVQARPVSQIERSWRWCRRKPIVASLFATIALLIVIISIVSSVAAVHLNSLAQKESQARLRAEEAQRVAEMQQARFQREKKRADAQAATAMQHLLTIKHEKRIARHILYAGHMNLAQTAWQEAHLENVASLLNQHRPTGRQEDIRNFEWYYFQRLGHQDLATLPANALVTSALYTPDGSHLILGNNYGRLEYWNLSTQQKTFSKVLHQGKINQLAMSPDGHHIATVGNDRTIVIWDLDRQEELKRLTGHTGQILTVCFNHDGTQLATGSADATVKIWNPHNGECMSTLSGHRSSVISSSFSPDGRHLATGSRDVTARIWDLSSGRTEAIIRHYAAVDSVQFNSTNTLLATGSGNGNIKLSSTSDFRHLKTIESGQLAIRHLQFTPDGKQLASAGADTTIKLWDVPIGTEIRTFKGHHRPVRWLAFRADGKEFVSASWDLTLKQWSTTPPFSSLNAHEHVISDLDFSPDGKWLATASADQTVKLWQLPDRQIKHVFSDPESAFATVCFSPDGRWLAAGTQNGMLHIWDRSNNQLKVKQRIHRQRINQISFTADSHWIGSASHDGLVKLWNVGNDELVGVLQGHKGAVQTIAFSPDGQHCVSGGKDGLLRIWNRHNQQLVQEISADPLGILSADWSANGEWIASSGYSRSIRLWHAQSGKLRSELKGHTGPVTQVRFSPDNKRIVSASYDFSIKLWDTVCSNEVLTMRGHRAVTWCAQFSPQGDWIASGSSDRRIRLWDGRLLPSSKLSP